MNTARFPGFRLINEFNFAARSSINKPLVPRLMKSDDLDHRKNVLLIGPSGTGQSPLARHGRVRSRVMRPNLPRHRTHHPTPWSQGGSITPSQPTSPCKLDLINLDELGDIPANKAVATNRFTFKHSRLAETLRLVSMQYWHRFDNAGSSI